jgi:hypothetical protein
MEKKTLGRGLEDISEIFLSTSEEKEKEKEEEKVFTGFSSVSIREETCASCVNIVGDHFEEPRCRIFTFESEKYGVPHMDMITLNHAKYCQYFAPNTLSKTGKTAESNGKYEDHVEDESQVEETVIVRKKITYPHTESAQQNIRKALFKHLEEAYSIKSIELIKTEVASEQKIMRRKDEEVTIFIEELQHTCK